MCIVIVAKSKFPTREVLEKCKSGNSSGGAGIAWRENGRVHWKKSTKLSIDEILEYGSKEGPWVIHFRIATVGGVRDELCHPFPVTKDCSVDLEGSTDIGIIAHNGNWTNWHSEVMATTKNGHKVPEGPWSDSRGIAYCAAVAADMDKALTDVREKVALLTPTDLKIYNNGYNYGWHHDKQTDTFFSYNPFYTTFSEGYCRTTPKHYPSHSATPTVVTKKPNFTIYSYDNYEDLLNHKIPNPAERTKLLPPNPTETKLVVSDGKEETLSVEELSKLMYENNKSKTSINAT